MITSMTSHQTRTLVTLLLGFLLTACSTVNNPKYPRSHMVAELEKGNLFALHDAQRSGFKLAPDGLVTTPTRQVADPVSLLQKGVDRGDALSQARMAYYLLYGAPQDGQSVRDPQKALQLATASLNNQTLPFINTVRGEQKWLKRDRASILARNAREMAKRAEALLHQETPAAHDADALYARSQLYNDFYIRVLWDTGSGTVGGSPADYRHWMGLAAEAGHAEALDQMIALTSGAEKPQWQLKRALATGDSLDAPDMYALANSFHTSGQHEQALEWYRKAAAQGHAGAQKVVLQQTDPTALRLQTAAASGDANAMFQAGEYFRNGNWQGRDNQIALKWYLKAAEKDHPAATYRAALMQTGRDQSDLMYKARRLGNADADRWLASQQRLHEQRAAEHRQQQAEQQQRQLQQQQAMVERIDRNGSLDHYEIEVYCRAGGRRCQELRNRARNAQNQRNREAEAANLRRIQGIYDDGVDTFYESRRRTECLRRKNNPAAVANPEFAGKSVGVC